MNFYYYHFLTWPDLSWVAENEKGEIVGYVLGKIVPQKDELRHLGMMANGNRSMPFR